MARLLKVREAALMQILLSRASLILARFPRNRRHSEAGGKVAPFKKCGAMT